MGNGVSLAWLCLVVVEALLWFTKQLYMSSCERLRAAQGIFAELVWVVIFVPYKLVPRVELALNIPGTGLQKSQ